MALDAICGHGIAKGSEYDRTRGGNLQSTCTNVVPEREREEVCKGYVDESSGHHNIADDCSTAEAGKTAYVSAFPESDKKAVDANKVRFLPGFYVRI